MSIKNARYVDSDGNVRHFETNENMVVVDNGQKTLKQKLNELSAPYLIPKDEDLPIDQREKGKMYFKVTE